MRKAMKYYKLAFDNNHLKACFRLGTILFQCVRKDQALAAKFFGIGAKRGNIGSCYIYGLCALEGVGVPEDHCEAAQYLKITSDNGNSDAMIAYGKLLDQGDSIPVDHNESLKYFRKAAEMGNEDGQKCYNESRKKYGRNEEANSNINTSRSAGGNSSKCCILIKN